MSQSIKTILVPVDGSACSLRALQHAAEVAAALGATLRLLHATYRRPSDLPESPSLISEMLAGSHSHYNEQAFAKVAEEKAREVFAAAREQVDEGKVEVEEMMLEGDPATAIVRHARETEGCMLVIGRSGRNRAQELLLGSVSHRVVHQAPCPVTLVN